MFPSILAAFIEIRRRNMSGSGSGSKLRGNEVFFAFPPFLEFDLLERPNHTCTVERPGAGSMAQTASKVRI